MMFVTSKRHRWLEEDFQRLHRKEQATFIENQILRAENERLKAENRLHRENMAKLMDQVDVMLGNESR